MKLFLAGFVLGILGVAAAVWLYFASGRAPVATADAAMPFEKTLAKKALDARIGKEAPKSSPVAADEANFLGGAAIYKQNCAVCHGLPGQDRTTIAAGMYPGPPQLFHGAGVSDDPPGETYWKAANGIRLTGMPGFKAKLSETQLWQVSQLLANADKIPDSVKKSLAESVAPKSQ
jgi:mono/diheme cytochrome c family protein